MSDTSLNRIIQYGTNAERLAFVPDPAAGSQVIYIWYETDTGETYLYDTTWHLISGAGGGNINVSAGTTSNNLTNLVFSNSNSVSFGLNGSTITASINKSINLLAGTTSNNLTAAVFSNSNNVSFGLSGSTITAIAGAGNINVSGGTTSNDLTSLVFSNSNNAAFGLNGSTVTVSAPINFSAGTTSNNLTSIIFSNSNGVSFGLDGSTVTASAAAAGLSAINISAGTTSNNLSNLVFSNSNGISFGLNGSTITASGGGGGGGAVISYIANLQQVISVVAFGAESISAMLLAPLVVPQTLSATLIRHMFSNVFSQQTIGNTSINTTFTYSQGYTWGIEAFTKGTGASSLSLMSHQVFTVGHSIQTVVMNGAVGSNYTVSYDMTYPRGGGTSTFALSFAATSGSYVLSTSAFSQFSNIRFMEFPFSSLSPGNYWMGLGFSNISTNSGGAAGWVSAYRPDMLLAGQTFNFFPLSMGQTNNNYGLQLFGGKITTNSLFFSTDGINLSQLVTQNNRLPYFEMLGL